MLLSLLQPLRAVSGYVTRRMTENVYLMSGAGYRRQSIRSKTGFYS
jgi:hypothetical protein